MGTRSAAHVITAEHHGTSDQTLLSCCNPAEQRGLQHLEHIGLCVFMFLKSGNLAADTPKLDDDDGRVCVYVGDLVSFVLHNCPSANYPASSLAPVVLLGPDVSAQKGRFKNPL